MESYIELIIQANEKKFTDVEKVIAAYFLAGRKALGIQELAKTLNVSNSSITRFCKKIGLSNYKELIYLYKYSNKNTQKEQTSGISYVQLNYSLLLNDLIEKLDTEAVKEAALLIDKSRIIHYWGTGYNAFCGEDFQFKFSRLGKLVNVIKDEHSIAMMAHTVQPGDLVVLSSLSGNNETIAAAVKTVAEKEVPVIVITANESSLYKENVAVFCLTSSMGKKDMGGISPQIPVLTVIDAFYTEILAMYHQETIKSWIKSEVILKGK
jgi:DNA-binding MurR/RpiR family transcriptional regulator